MGEFSLSDRARWIFDFSRHSRMRTLARMGLSLDVIGLCIGEDNPKRVANELRRYRLYARWGQARRRGFGQRNPTRAGEDPAWVRHLIKVVLVKHPNRLIVERVSSTIWRIEKCETRLYRCYRKDQKPDGTYRVRIHDFSRLNVVVLPTGTKLLPPQETPARRTVVLIDKEIRGRRYGDWPSRSIMHAYRAKQTILRGLAHAARMETGTVPQQCEESGSSVDGPPDRGESSRSAAS